MKQKNVMRLLSTPKVQLGFRLFMLSLAVITMNGFVAALALFTPFIPQLSANLGDVPEEMKELLSELEKKNGAAIAEAAKKAVGEATKGLITKDDLAQELVNLGVGKEAISSLTETVKQQGMVIAALKASGTNIQDKDWRKKIESKFQDAELMKAVEQVAKSKSGMVTLYNDAEKVVGNITTSSVATDTGGNALLDLINADDLRGMNLQMPFIEEFATVTRTAKPVYTYADFIPKEGDAGFTAQGATKSQMDLKVEVKTVTPKKATGYQIMTTEAIQDIPRLQSEANNYVLRKVLLKRQNGILNGDGTNDTPIGVISKARAFDPASWPAADLVATPNLYDVIIAAANQINTTYNYTDEMEYMPNVAFMNPKDLAGLKLKKNEFGMYLFPQFMLNGETSIDGLRLVPKREIQAGKILVGDFTKLQIINYVDFELSMGWINDQFIKNLFTMLGENRFYTVVRELDRNAFLYDDISDIVAGIGQ